METDIQVAVPAGTPGAPTATASVVQPTATAAAAEATLVAVAAPAPSDDLRAASPIATAALGSTLLPVSEVLAEAAAPPDDAEARLLGSGTASAPTVTVKVWRRDADGALCFPELDDPDFAVPGLIDKAPLAVCISGGGFRATTLALGWLRALHHLGLLNKVRYLSVISGASWIGSALCFQSVADVSTFLGPYLTPQECTLAALQAVGDKNKSYARALADAMPLCEYLRGIPIATVEALRDRLLGCLGASVEERKQVAGHWTTAMAGAFLEPFGLGEANKSTVKVPGTKVAERIVERAAKVGRGDQVYDANVHDLPFLIIGQALLLPKTDSKFYPFEWTPLYAGCPAKYDDINPKLGAGWVETLGLNAELVRKPDGSEVEVEVRPMGPASLAEATGISSGYVSMMLTDVPEVLQKALGFHSARYFNMQDWATNELLLTDGGACDLFGIYPALRRQMPNIMVFNCNGQAMLNDLEAFSAGKDLAGLFGCASDPEYNQMHQVFKSEGFKALFEALKAKNEAGEAPVHVDKYEVLENGHLGIPGGWATRVMWVCNERMATWEEKLPQETRALIPSPTKVSLLGEAGLNDFPYVDTNYMRYTPELVSLLANHAAWMLVSNEGLVREMVFGKAVEAVEAVAVEAVAVEAVAMAAVTVP